MKSQKQKQSDYETKVSIKFPHIVIYDDYIDWNTPIWHYCLIHWRSFEATPMEILYSKTRKGCLECSGIILWTYQRLQGAISEIKFPDGSLKFLLLTSEDDFNKNYKGNKTRIRLKCLLDGYEWETNINNLISGGNGCKRCSGQEEWTYLRLQVAISALKYPDGSLVCTLEMSETDFIKAYEKNGINTKIDVRCAINKDHIWSPRLNDLINNKTGCPNCKTIGYSKAEIEWLEFVIRTEGIVIQYKYSKEGQFKINGRFVDGYCKETNTIYQFHGDYWHGNPAKYDQNKSHPRYKEKGLTYGDKYKETLIKDQELRDQGYNVVVMWESEWKDLKKIIC